MKKLIALIAIFVCVGSALSAQISMSAGGGALLDASIGNGYKYTGDNKDYSLNSTSNNITIGAFGFFDATYVEVDAYFGLGFLNGKTVEKIGGKTDTYGPDEKSTNLMQLGFSVLGKYPIYISDVMTVFPLAGASFNMVLSMKYDGEEVTGVESSDYNQLGFLAGAGLDYNLSSSLFIRAEGLLHFRLPYLGLPDAAKDTKYTLGIGPQLKVGAGFRF
jgi:opacity protein-like surface antigen